MGVEEEVEKEFSGFFIMVFLRERKNMKLGGEGARIQEELRIGEEYDEVRCINFLINKYKIWIMWQYREVFV